MTGLDPHHVFSKGAGRVDVAANLIGLCRACHNGVHAGTIKRDRLLTIVAKRERITVEEIQLTVWTLRRKGM